MRIKLSEVFEVAVVGDQILVQPKRPVAAGPFWELRLDAEIGRTHDATRLAGRAIEVAESEDGTLQIEGFAAVEAR